MNVIRASLAKELVSYFCSPITYVIAVLFYLCRGLEVQALASRMAALGGDRDLFSTYYVFQQTTYFMVVLVPPLLTMRCFAEERRTGSLEVLMTAPVRDVEIVLGKWLAAAVLFAVLWLPTLFLLWVLTAPPFLGQDLAFGPVVSGYLGLSLLGALLLAAGCFTSSLTDNLLLAALSAMLFNVALLAGPSIQQPLVAANAANAPPRWLETLLQQSNVADHLANWFARGLVDTSLVAFYAAGTAFFLLLTVLSLGSRRWR